MTLTSEQIIEALQSMPGVTWDVKCYGGCNVGSYSDGGVIHSYPVGQWTELTIRAELTGKETQNERINEPT